MSDPDRPPASPRPRTLILMRHGKSGYPDGVADHDRPLAARGRTEAALAGDWIRGEIGTVDAVICSTATRTRETLAATTVQAPVRYEQTVYGGSPEAILAEIIAVGDDVSTLLVIGHAPGIPYTALKLAANSDSDHAAWIRDRFPTSALAVLTTDSTWTNLSAGGATLVHALRLQ